MNDQIGVSLETLRRKVEEFEKHLRDLKKWIGSAETSRVEVQRRIAAAEGAVKRIEDDSLAAGARMQLQAEESTLASASQVEAWQRDREMEKLRSRAEDAEAYAAWSLIVATRAIDEAELATLKSIATRMDFENGTKE